MNKRYLIHMTLFQPHIIDVAICWNYLVVADSEGIVKYGLANGKHGQCRLPLPPGGTKVRQISATPRHLLVVTENGGKNGSFYPVLR